MDPIRDESVFEAPAVQEVVDALHQRAREGAAPASAAGRIAAEAEAREWTSIEDPHLASASGAEEDTRRLWVILAVGALGRALEVAGADASLAELGVDPVVLRERWVPELEAWAHERIGALLAAGQYEAARALSDRKIQALAPVRGAPAGGRTAGSSAASPPIAPSPGAPPGPIAHTGSEPAPPVRPAAPARRAAPAAWPSGNAEPPELPPNEAAQPGPARRSGHRLGRRLAGGLAAALLAGAAWWLQPPAGSVEILGARELAALSPHLETAYRDTQGSRSILIGTVAPSWRELRPEERIDAGRALGGRLGEVGIAEVMLFDRAHRLALHLQDGRLRHPAPGRGDPALPAQKIM